MTTSGIAKGRTLLTGNANPLTGFEPGTARQGRGNTDQLISITDIRALFKLGRTAAYELTHRPGFPAPVQVSRRCLRWWASEVNAYADTLQREGARCRARRATTRQADDPAVQPRRITGTVRAARGRKKPS
jgi:predicted DNA-binding transcriptional regulator AlpA